MLRHEIFKIIDKRSRLLRKLGRVSRLDKDKRDELKEEIKKLEKKVSDAGFILRDTNGGTTFSPKVTKDG